jgi:hypothetical protein
VRRLNSIRDWPDNKPFRADVAAIVALSLVWAFYFWRVITPNQADQVSLPQGDYSGQFLAFGAYQAERLLEGEIPLWNPYNRGGHPFLADTQAAVFYPSRLVTILISHFVSSGWNYAALQAETIAHYWLASLFMFFFARTVTRSRLGGIVSAIVFTYGGYLTGYPPLQLAILEAAVWLPVALLGIHKATEQVELSPSPRFAWLSLSAFALGIGLLAGHPQTSLYSAYLCLGYLVYRGVVSKLGLIWIISALFIVIGLGFGIAAIQLLPGLEYTRLTTRAGYGFDQLANGFPFSDLIGAVLPKVLSIWSPLYSGIVPLILAAVAVMTRARTARFWAVIVGLALAISFGRNTIAYALMYLSIPGFSLFRGQERAAFLIAIGIAMLAGLGTASLISGHTPTRLSRLVGQLALAACGFAALLFVVERAIPREETYAALRAAMFFALICILAWGLFARSRLAAHSGWQATMLGLIIFDLFSVTMGTNWQPIPVSQRDLVSDLVPPVLSDDTLYRVDGRLGLGENYGSLLGIQDIRGTSPLWLATLEDFYHLPEERLYQLLSVKYVFTDWQQLTVPTTIIVESNDGSLPLYLHDIQNPTPRVWMVYSVMDTPDRAQALGWLADPSFDPLHTVILQWQPDLNLPAAQPTDSSVSIVSYEPEHIELAVTTSTDGVLVISEMDYPGWVAFIDGNPAPILNADAGIRALALHEGTHTIILEFEPISFKIGTAITLLSLITLVATASASLMRRKHFT